MRSLSQLVRTLSKREINLLRMLHQSHNNSDKKNPRTRLFELLLSDQAITDKEAATAIYNAKPNSAFSHLKTRLKNDIYCILLQNGNDDSKPLDFLSAKYQCTKSLSLADLLVKRGLFESAKELLIDATELATKYELPVEKILLEDAQFGYFFSRSDKNTFRAYNKKIFENVSLVSNIIKAKSLYQSICDPDFLKQKKKPENTLNELKKLFGSTKSARIGYYYYLSAMHYNIALKKYLKSIRLGLELMQRIQKNTAVYSRANIAFANTQIATAAIYNYNFATARGFAKVALENMAEGEINQLYALELYFISLFNEKIYGEAKKVLVKAMNHFQIKSSGYSFSQWNYYNAIFEFRTGNFKKSLFEINSCKMPAEDNSGWCMILEIMNMVELKEKRGAIGKLKNYKKFLGRMKTGSDSRAIASFKILQTFVRTDFNHELTFRTEKKLLNLLSAGKKNYCWNPLSYEIIRFDEWLLINKKI